MRNLVNRITELRERWRIELKECQDSLLDAPSIKRNILDRMVVEFDYLLVEAQLKLKSLDVHFADENGELLNLLDWQAKLQTEVGICQLEKRNLEAENAGLVRASNSLLGLIDCLGGGSGLDNAGPDRVHLAELVNYPEAFAKAQLALKKPNIRDCTVHIPPDCPNCINEMPTIDLTDKLMAYEGQEITLGDMDGASLIRDARERIVTLESINAELVEALEDSGQYLGKLAADHEGNYLGRSTKGRLDRNTLLIRKARTQ